MEFNSITSDYFFRNLSAIGAEKHIFSAFFPQNFYGPQSPLKSLKVLENP